MTTLQILYHGNCFDGVTSAAMFLRFYRERLDPEVSVRTRGMMHQRGDPYGADHDATFDADVNVALDFRYSPSSRLHWWCDHHHSAFLKPEDRVHFEADTSGRKHFDPAAPSCAGLLSRWLAADHGWAGDAVMQDHVRWADLIDSAAFVDARQAVELAEPALQLMALLESAPAELVERLLEGLSRGSIEQVHADSQVQKAIGPVLQAHRDTQELVRQRLQIDSRVATFDLADQQVGALNKFIPYHLASDIDYVVNVTATPSRAKVSVGSNPFDRPDPLVNLAELCARYGGGGHPVVAAVSLPPDAIDEARRAAAEIAAELRQSEKKR